MITLPPVNALFAGKRDLVSIRVCGNGCNCLQGIRRKVRRPCGRRGSRLRKYTVEAERRSSRPGDKCTAQQHLRGLPVRRQRLREGTPVAHPHGERNDIAGSTARRQERLLAWDVEGLVRRYGTSRPHLLCA